MATQYFCHDEERRELARSNARNGIDYIEVLDLESPSGAPRQRTLLVHFLSPLNADIDADRVEIEGGARVTGILVEWTARNASVDPALTSVDEAAFYGSLDDNVLIVRTDRYGDHSTYTLRIADLDPAEFDLVLADVPFSFKAECPHDFDCLPETECPPTPEVEPPINYLARDYGALRGIMLDRMSVVMPDWKDRHQVPDVQVALVEAMAYVGDRLSYSQDAVTTEAYLGTAQQRMSMRRHGRLLDYRLHEGTNARVWMHVEVEGSQSVVVPAGAQFMTKLENGSPTLLPPGVAQPPGERHPYEEALELSPVIFEAMAGSVLFSQHNAIGLYTWGDVRCCLPAGSTRATLLDNDDDPQRLRLRVGDVVIFEQVVDPVTGLQADADPERRHAVRLTKVVPEATVVVTGGVVTDRNPGPLSRDLLPRGGNPGPAVVEIEWDERDALPFALCISEEIEGELREDLALARANVILADHGRTMPDAEELEVDIRDRPYRPLLAEEGISYREAFPTGPGSLPSAGNSLSQSPRSTLPAITLMEDGEPWAPVQDLLGSDRFARRFVVETHNDRTATLRFGDGRNGREPVPGSRLTASYRIGNGAQGNVGRDSITHIVMEAPVTRVRNPLPASGGIEPEAANHVRLYAPEAFRIQERAVTEADYAEVTERRSDIQEAAGTRRWTGSWHTMFVTADRVDGQDVDAEFGRELRDYLGLFRLAGQDVEIDGPRFAPLDIAIRVCVTAGYFSTDVKQVLRDVLSSRSLPDGRRGFFHPDNFTFGDTLYLSALVAAAMEVDGVEWVDVTRFHRWGQTPQLELAEGRIAFGPLEILQVANDPNSPENGRLELIMEGGE